MVLEGASALVTGAGRGIGRAIAVTLAEEGARVTAVARTAADLDSLAEHVRSRGGVLLGVPADLRRADGCRRAVEAAVAAHGGLQILVNNAGVGAAHPVAETPDEEWETVISTNLTSVFRLTRAALPHLRERGGHVFMISSLAGRNAIAGMAAYCASKAALDHFAACLMLEVRKQGIKVTTVAPGSVDTAFADGFRPGDTDASWKLTAQDVAACVLDLLHARDDAHLSRVEMRPLRPPSGA
jgi:NAD(P)-dependent dehydrogenase (short-subunit alcohol dehydrogenase family)